MKLGELKIEVNLIMRNYDYDFVVDAAGRFVGNCFILPSLKEGQPEENVFVFANVPGRKTTFAEFREFVNNIGDENNDLEVVDAWLNVITGIRAGFMGKIIDGKPGEPKPRVLLLNK